MCRQLKLAVKHDVLTPRGSLHAGIASLATDLGVPALPEPAPVRDGES
ncbi:hypothetical protein NX794_09970 [Streptomyces sp. LP11]|uniref:Uncharacterized protein n=1 Tax=Streptomyces pyxinicus TaxID=2970331 RepID=A0ABT2AZ59_9ACTN|nr:hypothetical protein [Streptomyces sp. LP11]MCS0601552.1 hypothetical protein [Streptomyces sp. LP11]